ncbi:tetratricopeptide repeat protein [Saprospiraceae bacterium]|nr:tetratricopeptide repeat protein [Saprospiraceae bacterium]
MNKLTTVDVLLKVIEQTIQVRNARYDDDVDMPKGPLFSILIGSGFSVTAGLSTVGHFILSLEQFKKDRNQNWNDVFDLTKPLSISDRKLTAPQLTDYYFSLIEDVLPLPQARHDFITAAIQWASSRKVQINIESILLAAVLISSTGGSIPLDKRKAKRHWMAKAFSRHVFTTNFDEVMPTTFYLGNSPVDILDNDKNSSISVAAEYPTVVYLHGRHLHYKIRNTKFELHRTRDKHLEPDLFQGFRNVLRSTGLIVIGYAGAEDKVTQIINEAVADPESLPYGLWWSVYQNVEKSVHPNVKEMVSHNNRCYFLEKGKDAEQLMRLLVRGVGINDGEVIGIWKNRLGIIGNEVNRFIERATFDFHKFNVGLIQSLIFMDDQMMAKAVSEWKELSEHLYEHEDQNHIVDILQRVGQLLIEMGEIEEGKKVYLKLFELLKSRNETEKLANSYLDYGTLLIFNGEYIKSKETIDLANKLFKSTKSKIGLIRALTLLAEVDWINNDLDKSKKSLKLVAKYSKELNYKLGLANYHNGIAKVLYTESNYTEAIDNFNEALKLHEVDGNERLILNDLRGLSKCLIKLRKENEADKVISKAYTLSKDLNNMRELSHSLLILGKHLKAFSNSEEAVNRLNEALRIFKIYKDNYGIIETTITISE